MPLPRAEVGGRGPKRAGPPVLKSLAWLGGLVATVCALGVAAVLAVVFAASLVLIGLIARATIALGGLAYRARRTSQPSDPTLLEARHVGGHSWVAYGWDQRGR
mgnify:CR=1 FL=1